MDLSACCLSWCSKQEQTIAVSSTEAEYMAATQAAKEALWYRTVLAENYYCPTQDNTADIFTKPLDRLTFQRHRNSLNVQPL